MFRKSHIPLVPRTANYSCSLANRSPRKRTAGTQTERHLPLFQSNKLLKEEIEFNEETAKIYSMALEYVNGFHSYLNKKLSENYGECGDSQPEKNDIFKLPEVPNYATIYFMLLDKTKASKLASNTLKKRVNSLKPELQPKKFTAKESIIEFVPEIKKLSEYKFLELSNALEETKRSEREVQTVSIDDDCVSSPTKTLSDDVSGLSSKKSSNSNSHTAPTTANLDLDKTDVEDINVSSLGTSESRSKSQKSSKEEVTGDRVKSNADVALEQRDALEESSREGTKDEDKIVMMEIIKQRVQEEIVTFLDKTSGFSSKTARPRLIRSHFHVVNIPPQINLLEYAQKKLERQLCCEPEPNCSEAFQKQFFNNPISARKSQNLRPVTPVKVSNMFRKLSQENFRNLEEEFGGESLKYDFGGSDGDSVILDDEEFEKINGHVSEQGDKKQRGHVSGSKEKSSPLKLNVRDMSKVNEKMLNTIGIFTERGDIRPEVIDILEEQKRMKSKDSRNKQFRSRRQWDLQIHLNPKQNIDSSFTSVSTDKSFISLSSADLKTEFETVKNVSQQVEYDR